MLNMKTLTHSKQDNRINEFINLRDLQHMKKEIEVEAKSLKPKLVKEIEKGSWPMLKYNMEVKTLVVQKQKYLSLLSSKYSLRSTQVNMQFMS